MGVGIGGAGGIAVGVGGSAMISSATDGGEGIADFVQPEGRRGDLPAVKTVRVQGICLSGTQANLVTVEARFERGERQRTEVVLSGLPDPVIRESRGRLLCALEENRLRLPRGRLILNLTPAGLRKTGEFLDLPLALGAAAAGGHLTPASLKGTLFLGEMGIDGRLFAVPGGLAAAEVARRSGLGVLVAPEATAREAACLPGIEVLAAKSLAEVVRWVASGEGLPVVRRPVEGDGNDDGGRSEEREAEAVDALLAVRGQASGKRALCAAAGGGHGLLFLGPPGTGKSLLARILVHLLPPPDLEERLDITRVLSATRRWPEGLVSRRPFRAPHHTTSYAGLVGGGSPPAPGEITLAHRGVLFLDELPEFRRETLEALRQPLEAGQVTISRAGRQLELPADFQLISAMNPCPCGYRGHPTLPCRCSPAEIRRYRHRISGPLLDRIDLRVELPVPAIAELAPPPQSAPQQRRLREEAARSYRSVQRARKASLERQGGCINANLDAEALDTFAPLLPASRRLLERAVEKRGLSARAIQSVRRLARTVADLEGESTVAGHHLAEALALRAPLR
jgi:magnesium chelatase family protein